MTWVDTETGEVAESCPLCARTEADCETQIRAMERERRADRAARSKAENAAEKALVAHRDASLWKRALAHWQAVFPEKKPSSTGIKSARATKYFLRLEAGATPEDVELAVVGAKDWPYVVFGKRQRTGSKSDLADDLQDIVSLNNDANFDFLVEAGRARA